ncbi:regulatory protein MarR [Gordonia bronchialis DSM 43247]|uniref:Regulatory protein MarR n=1 Tax=Gordonia bronchialis (strain ATCC 25592 / DSM 43247 / BCRC 13721 / JCM 3198 / KCTC 3076 / NBRC 16047 / NCTC 10667) TaxID=526226 RepID=D0L9K6_GORB4|nr:MarR family transcriptional regulator [Gordonia bronchialis]ACY21194.1 regulatory protein MarR [Gordonia bronchialis DSM 43247]MCC3323977.1 MarR family transcriptional regulator [Gordonia bronchialis]QGS25115.1 MarR family transcriptional regulator [Gordonia bronchialis]UAK38609.1 MarR family transcriptional regulator [Gordonia bronchialis]STQ64065.1 homoprotocatechuate degradation operon regulator, HpaR [Gordonia bronchialis]
MPERHEDPLLLQLLRAAQLISDRLAPVLDDCGVTGEQWRVLEVLAAGEGLPMTDLSRLAVLPPASATRAVDRLISLALVYRRADPLDRRRVMVFLSPHGAQTTATVGERRRAIERELAGAIGSRRYLGITDGLDHLIRAQTATGDDAADRSATDLSATDLSATSG